MDHFVDCIIINVQASQLLQYFWDNPLGWGFGCGFAALCSRWQIFFYTLSNYTKTTLASPAPRYIIRP
jgi:hypothetical protein